MNLEYVLVLAGALSDHKQKHHNDSYGAGLQKAVLRTDEGLQVAEQEWIECSLSYTGSAYYKAPQHSVDR